MGLLQALLQISGPSHYWLIDYLLPDNLTGVKSIDILDAENCLTFLGGRDLLFWRVNALLHLPP